MSLGRPKIFDTAEQMQEAIDAYFLDCKEREKPYTLSGLALALGVDRKTIINYARDDEFFHTVKNARAMCENYAEEQLFEGRNVAGVIFNLKNNYDWKDKTEQQISGGLALRKEELTDDELAAIAAGGRKGASTPQGGTK